jgi:hypothetical protein
MQKRLFAFVFALFMTAAVYDLPLYAQESQTIEVKIPFAFLARGKALPAGKYRITPLSSGRELWGIRSSDNTIGRLVLAMTRAGSTDGKLVATFRRYGNTSFLVGFTTPSYEIALPTSAAEKALRDSKAALRSRNEVVGIGTGPDRSGQDKRR